MASLRSEARPLDLRQGQNPLLAPQDQTATVGAGVRCRGREHGEGRGARSTASSTIRCLSLPFRKGFGNEIYNAEGCLLVIV